MSEFKIVPGPLQPSVQPQLNSLNTSFLLADTPSDSISRLELNRLSTLIASLRKIILQSSDDLGTLDKISLHLDSGVRKAFSSKKDLSLSTPLGTNFILPDKASLVLQTKSLLESFKDSNSNPENVQQILTEILSILQDDSVTSDK
jgi:hypothetical protein